MSKQELSAMAPQVRRQGMKADQGCACNGRVSGLPVLQSTPFLRTCGLDGSFLGSIVYPVKRACAVTWMICTRAGMKCVGRELEESL